MKRLTFACVALALGTVPALAQGAIPSLLSVSGEATISVAPDQATIDGGVATDAKTAKDASDANNAAMGKVLLALKGAGIAEKDVQTQRLSLQPQYQQARTTGPNVVASYRASNRVSVRLRDIAQVAQTVDLLVAAGANEIGGIQFSVSSASRLLDDAREQAVADARRKAEIYARAAGVTLGDPVSISEGGADAPMALRKMTAGFARPAAAPVAIGEETLGVTVSVTWSLLPKAAPNPTPKPE